MTRKAETGFTLIELMVVVALVGIISAIAYPSYQNYIADTYKSQAVADLNICAMALERHFSNDFRYTGAVINSTAASLCPDQSPGKGTAKYDVTLAAVSTTTFTVRAKPVGGGSCGGNCVELEQDGTLTEL